MIPYQKQEYQIDGNNGASDDPRQFAQQRRRVVRRKVKKGQRAQNEIKRLITGGERQNVLPLQADIGKAGAVGAGGLKHLLADVGGDNRSLKVLTLCPVSHGFGNIRCAGGDIQQRECVQKLARYRQGHLFRGQAGPPRHHIDAANDTKVVRQQPLVGYWRVKQLFKGVVAFTKVHAAHIAGR